MLSKLSNLRLSTKILLQALVIIVFFSIMTVWVAWKTKDKIYNEKTLATKHVVEVAYLLITEYDNRAKKGEFSLEEAQKRASLRVQNLRYIWNADLPGFGVRMLRALKPASARRPVFFMNYPNRRPRAAEHDRELSGIVPRSRGKRC